jgi:hypothetical protein
MIKAMSMGGTITYLSPGEMERSGELHSQPTTQGRAWEDWCSQAGIELENEHHESMGFIVS